MSAKQFSPRLALRPLFTRLVLFGCLLLIGVGLTACTDAEYELVAEFFVVWAEENGILQNEELNLPALVDQLYVEALFDWSNTDPDAALDAVVEVPNSIEEADALAEQGADWGSLELINKAIEARPNDWSYYDQGGAVALRLGNHQEEEAYRQSADNLVLQNSQNSGHCNFLRLNQLRNRRAALDVQLTKDFKSASDFDLMDATRNDTLNEIQLLEGGGDSPFCQAVPEG